jgi:hypothetical protein
MEHTQKTSFLNNLNGKTRFKKLNPLGWVGLFLFTNLYPCLNRGTHIGYVGVNSPL